VEQLESEKIIEMTIAIGKNFCILFLLDAAKLVKQIGF
jgi:hypothetical protein